MLIFVPYLLHPKMRFIFFLFFSCTCLAQTHEPFQGKLVYSIEMVDTAMQKYIPTRTMIVYTNDTIVRIENETAQLGKQVVIKHTLLKKSILLLQNGNTKYAIQTDLSKEEKPKNDTIKPTYTYKKKLGKRKILGMKANRLLMISKTQKTSLEILYLKQYSSKYIDAYGDVPGLPVRYFLNTDDGVVVYTLVYIEKKVVNRDLFGIPSDYKKVTFDQFLDEVLEQRK